MHYMNCELTVTSGMWGGLEVLGVQHADEQKRKLLTLRNNGCRWSAGS